MRPLNPGGDLDYLTHKAEQLGNYPEVVLAGSLINDGIGRWLVEQLVLAMARRGVVFAGGRVLGLGLGLGLSFKENCPALRNTRVVDVIAALQRYGMEPLLVDPWVDP